VKDDATKATANREGTIALSQSHITQALKNEIKRRESDRERERERETHTHRDKKQSSLRSCAAPRRWGQRILCVQANKNQRHEGTLGHMGGRGAEDSSESDTRRAIVHGVLFTSITLEY